MRQVMREVQVEFSAGGQPRHIQDSGRRLTVTEVLDWWRSGGRWWLGEPCRDCWKIETPRGTFDLHHEDGGLGRWWLAGVQD